MENGSGSRSSEMISSKEEVRGGRIIEYEGENAKTGDKRLNKKKKAIVQFEGSNDMKKSSRDIRGNDCSGIYRRNVRNVTRKRIIKKKRSEVLSHPGMQRDERGRRRGSRHAWNDRGSAGSR